MLNGTIDELTAAGCIQTSPPELFIALKAATKGDICNGCPELKGGTCRAYQKYHTTAIKEREAEEAAREKRRQATRPQGTEKYPNMSVAQIADTLGVSKNKVRKLKWEGKI